MRKAHFHLAVSATALAAALAGPAHAAADLYGTVYPSATPLYLMNQATGAATVGPATGMGGIADLASSGTTTSVWGVSESSNTLFRFDAATGAVLGTVAVTGAPEPIVSLAWDNALDVLYGSTAASFGGFNNLYRIDPGTGAATLIGNLQIDKIYALAYNPADKFLYGANGEIGETSYLWKIDPSSAAAIAMGALEATGNFDLAFRPGDNVLFMASSDSYSLYTVNPLNAVTTLVGPYGDPLNIAGLAFAVPEPETWALMAGGLLLVARRLASTRGARRDD
ncbi:MAG: hypothetical protein ACK5WT_02590 [Betaproteobacteria bacterium]